jgi:hypothetical protein
MVDEENLELTSNQEAYLEYHDALQSLVKNHREKYIRELENLGYALQNEDIIEALIIRDGLDNIGAMMPLKDRLTYTLVDDKDPEYFIDGQVHRDTIDGEAAAYIENLVEHVKVDA